MSNLNVTTVRANNYQTSGGTAIFSADNNGLLNSVSSTILKTTSITHTNSTTAINIYSNGMVGYPNIPAFHAYRSGGASSTALGIFTTNFTATLLNNGNHYNTGNGRFTCPVVGIYKFEMLLLHRFGASNLETTFYRNGNNISERSMGYTYVTGGSDHDPLYISAYISCSANDFIQCGVTACGPGTDYYFGQNLAYFSGCLIG
jgi:hypothetical protein